MFLYSVGAFLQQMNIRGQASQESFILKVTNLC